MDFILAILKGFSEVFFQESPIFGTLILVGLTIASPLAALFAVIGNITSTVVGHLLPVNKGLVDAGVYGFNGALVGTAVAFYLKTNIPLAVIFVVFGSILAALLFYILAKNGITPFALPFVIIATSLVIFTKYFKVS